MHGELMEKVLITDFDGTITRHDFYKLATERLLTPKDLAPWGDYRNGSITHFEALRRIFAGLMEPRAKVLEVIKDMQAEPRLKSCLTALHSAGWQVVVASAGSLWYINIILETLSVEPGKDLTVHSNPGTYPENGPLLLEAPLSSPFYCAETGIDKLAIVQSYIKKGATVAYAGDGFTDVQAALQVTPELRFARADLAAELQKQNAPYNSFEYWGEVADTLVKY